MRAAGFSHSRFCSPVAVCWSLTMTDYMTRALELAAHARGNTGNNPAVGAVVVKGERVLGEGFTQPPGQAHAEVMALAAAGEAARGATVYVTLEPCCHFGRTPPCTDALISAGVAEVHMATLDPNPLVAGRGKASLEAAGIRTFLGEGEAEARHSMEAWLTYIQRGRPMITAKFAMSIDGKIATSSGDSKWITGPVARQRAHRLRADSGAVIVGIGTVLADDPELTARDADGCPLPRQPLRVVVDSQGRIPLSCKIVSGNLPGRTFVALGPGADRDKRRELERRGNVVVTLPQRDGHVSLEAVLQNLSGEWQITSALVEGGSALLGAFFDQRLVDKVVAFIAPKVIGGKEGIPAIGGKGAMTMSSVIGLRDLLWEQVGDDLMVTGYTVDGSNEPVGRRADSAATGGD